MVQERFPENPVLVVDDESFFLNSMVFYLRSNGISHVEQCNDSRLLMALLEKKKFSLLLLDLIMPHIGGKQLLPQIVEHYPDLPVIVLTGMDDVKIAVECMQTGAFNYLTKPIDTVRLIKIVQQTIEFMDVKKENILLKERLFSEDLKHPECFLEIITKNREMINIFKYMEATAASKFPVLVTGETGTGKELFVNAIHKVGNRQGKLVLKKVGGLDHKRFLDELYGSENKTGLLDEAKDGTLFLDEIADISNESQVALFQLIQEREYIASGVEKKSSSNARLVTATCKDLKSMSEKGEFRKDLYYRLQAHHIHIPPLRNRKEDIPSLVDHFVEESAKMLNKDKPRVPRGLTTLLASYDFPGNLRELGLMVYDVVNINQNGILPVEIFREKIRKQQESMVKICTPEELSPVDTMYAKKGKIFFGESLPTFKELEELYINEAIKRAEGDGITAARLTGLSEEAFNHYLEKLPGRRME